MMVFDVYKCFRKENSGGDENVTKECVKFHLIFKKYTRNYRYAWSCSLGHFESNSDVQVASLLQKCKNANKNI